MVQRVVDLANPGGWVAKEVAFEFKNNLVWGKTASKRFQKEFKKVGQKIVIKKEVQWDAVDGVETGGDITGAVQPIDQRDVILTVNANPIVPYFCTDRDMALSLTDFREQFVKPAAYKLANMAELAIARAALKFSSAVGVAGTTPDDFDAVAAAGEALDILSVPRDSRRHLIIDPRANRKLAKSISEAFNPQAISGKAYTDGMAPPVAGFHIDMSQVIVTHIDGVQDGTGQVDGGDQIGASIDLKGFTSGDQLLANAIITLGVNSVNRFTKEDTGKLMQFRVTADATANGSGEMTVTIAPPIEVEGPYQNVVSAPLNNAPVVVDTYGASGPVRSPVNAAFHSSALVIATIPLEQPKGLDISTVLNFDGWQLRYLQGFNILTGQWVSRMELLFAVDVIEETAGVRVLG